MVPARDATHLDRLALALEQQSYPLGLLDLTVVDDRSDPPIELPSSDRLEIHTLRSDGEGFGAGRCRNEGAAATNGEILLFLDADVVPSRDAVASHARWHHATADAVVVGGLRMTGIGEVTELMARLRSGPADEALGHLSWEPVEWSETARGRSAELVARRADHWATVIGANVSIRRRSFDRIGGFTPFGIRGIEDIEFGCRAFLDGALIVPDAEAFVWHPRARHFADPQAAATAKRKRQELMEHHIPFPPARSAGRQRAAVVPQVMAHVDIGRADVEQITTCVESLLAAISDMAVHLVGTEGHADEQLLTEAFQVEPRVRNRAAAGKCRPELSAVHLLLEEPVALKPDGLARLVQPLLDNQVGVVQVEGGSPTVVAVSTRAWNRAARLLGHDEPIAVHHHDAVLEEAARWFGHRWASRTETHSPEVSPTPANEDAAQTSPARPLSATELRWISLEQRIQTLEVQLEQERERHAATRGELAQVRNRRVVRLVDRLGARFRA